MLNLQIRFIPEKYGHYTAICRRLEIAAGGNTKHEALRALLYMIADVAEDYVTKYDRYSEGLRELLKDFEVLR